MLSAAKYQNNSMLCFGLDLKQTRFSDKLKDDGSGFFGVFAAIVDSVANLASA